MSRRPSLGEKRCVLRRRRLHDLLDRIAEEDLPAVELFLELFVEPVPGFEEREAVLLERILRLLDEVGRKRHEGIESDDGE